MDFSCKYGGGFPHFTKVKSSVETEADNTVEIRAALNRSASLCPLSSPNVTETIKCEYAKQYSLSGFGPLSPGVCCRVTYKTGACHLGGVMGGKEEKTGYEKVDLFLEMHQAVEASLKNLDE